MIEYRPAGPSDAHAVALLHTDSWRRSYRGEFSDDFLDHALPDERIAVWTERLGHPPEHQLVQLACDGTELVGFVCAYGAHDPQWGSFIDNLHVAASAMRAGVGTSLMRRAGAWLDERHPELGVHLWVLASNARARRFYERLGASNAETTTMETHGGAMVRSCRYVWPTARHLCDPSAGARP